MKEFMKYFIQEFGVYIIISIIIFAIFAAGVIFCSQHSISLELREEKTYTISDSSSDDIIDVWMYPSIPKTVK